MFLCSLTYVSLFSLPLFLKNGFLTFIWCGFSKTMNQLKHQGYCLIPVSGFCWFFFLWLWDISYLLFFYLFFFLDLPLFQFTQIFQGHTVHQDMPRFQLIAVWKSSCCLIVGQTVVLVFSIYRWCAFISA